MLALFNDIVIFYALSLSRPSHCGMKQTDGRMDKADCRVMYTDLKYKLHIVVDITLLSGSKGLYKKGRQLSQFNITQFHHIKEKRDSTTPIGGP